MAANLIALTAAFIAFAALIISIWQTAQVQKHNRLTVRPQLVVDRFNITDEPYSLYLSNAGSGPAILKNFVVTIDSNTDHPQRVNSTLDLFRILGLDMTGAGFTPHLGDAIAPGSKILLISIGSSGMDTRYRAIIAEQMKRVTITISYQSIYDELFSVTWSELKEEST